MNAKPIILRQIPVDEQLPDDETTVMLYHPSLDEPAWPGYHCDDRWHSADGMEIPSGAVTHWSDMPSGVEEATEEPNT